MSGWMFGKEAACRFIAAIGPAQPAARIVRGGTP